jgi:hypothetical protein
MTNAIGDEELRRKLYKNLSDAVAAEDIPGQ